MDCGKCIYKPVCDLWTESERQDAYSYLTGGVTDGCPMFKSTADVAEVKHSTIKWVNRPISAQYATVTDEHGEKHCGLLHDFIANNPVGYCGECGKRLDDTFMNYCPNCGAKMDGKEEEDAEDNAE